jgi:hypothetical protein
MKCHVCGTRLRKISVVKYKKSTQLIIDGNRLYFCEFCNNIKGLKYDIGSNNVEIENHV